jgi:LCP family protein required for cell wall assembly
MADEGDRPEYKVYRSRRGSPLRGGGGELDALRDRLRRSDDRRPKEPRDPRTPGKITPGRVFRWIAWAVAAWLLLSFVLFMVSAQLETSTSDEGKAALSGNGNFFTGATTLVLGSDQRKGASLDQSSAPGRADTIILVHAAFGSVHKLSIPRDAEAEIPGHGVQKINAAFAIGGTSLMIRTVEQYLGNGLDINHVMQVDFEDFPKFIDALGGITVTNKTKICSPEFDNFYRGFRLSRGEHHLDGRKALGFARVRKNPCAPNENDLDRAARQQEMLGGIKRRMFSPGTFFRLPLVSWRAPKALQTDLRGPGLMLLGLDIGSGGLGDTDVLRPSCLGCGQGGSLQVAPAERAAATKRLLGD